MKVKVSKFINTVIEINLKMPHFDKVRGRKISEQSKAASRVKVKA